jgi:hypothetical protein
MAINPLLPILIGAMQTRNVIKDQNEDEYDEVTGAFIDAAAAEFFADKAEQKKRIAKNEKLYKATESNFGTNVAEFVAKNNLFVGYDAPAQFIADIRAGQVMPLKLRKDLENEKFFNSQGFKTTFAQDQNLAKQQLEDKTLFAAKNLNKGAVSNLADLYLGTTTEKPSKLKSFLFGQKTPDVTAMAAGFEKGLEDTAEKTEQKISERSIDESQMLAKDFETSASIDTNVIQKMGYNEPVNIGTSSAVDRAIQSEYNLDSIQMRGDQLIFPTAYATRISAVKSIAPNLALSGAYGNPGDIDTGTLISAAIRDTEAELFKIQNAFAGYKLGSDFTKPVNATALAPNANLGKNFTTVFQAYHTPKVEGDLFKPEDLSVKAVGAGDNRLLMSNAAYTAMENYIKTLPTIEMREMFIEHLPSNFVVAVDQGKGNQNPVINTKVFLFRSFGIFRPYEQ